MEKPKLHLRQAIIEDTQAVVTLLNQCYRENVGWTNEADLIGGIRTTTAEIESVIKKEGHYLFVFPNNKAEESEANQSVAKNSNTSADTGSKTDVNRDNEIDNETDKLLGCIAVEMIPRQNKAYIGTFAVHPDLQGQGIGHQMLEAVETFACRHLGNRFDNAQGKNGKGETHSKDNQICLTMSILENRPELLAYYERRGYQLTGESMPFPEDGNNGEPKVSNLKLLTLEKRV